MSALPSARHIIWSCDPAKLDASEPWVRRWWIRQVLEHGRMEDVRALDLGEVKRLLPLLDLAPPIASLWRAFFDERRSAHHPDSAPNPHS